MPVRRKNSLSVPLLSRRWFTPTRWISLIFVVQLILVIFFMIKSRPTSVRPHHHFVDPDSYSSRHHFIVIGIVSDIASADRRQAVRETWLKFGGRDIEYKFVIGQPYCLIKGYDCDDHTLELENELKSESHLYRDILRVNVMENYNTLSEKVCAMVEWAAEQSFDYFLKTDHDIFIRLDTILEELTALGPKDNYWSGFAWHDVPPISDQSDKNRELVYDLGTFPPYTAGALHILSSNLVRALSSSLPRRYYQNEDQSLGIWLLPFNVTPKHDIRIQQWDVCHNDLIAKHPLSPTRMRDMYDNVINKRPLCDSFDTNRCPLCFECTESQHHWSNSGLTCDDVKGASTGEALLQSIRPKSVVPASLSDPAIAGVLGYLPFLECKKGMLEGTKAMGNYVVDGHLEIVEEKTWNSKGQVTRVRDGMVDYKSDPQTGCIKLAPDTSSKSHISYISQVITINQTVPEALVFSAWSKAEGVDATTRLDDYALYATIVYQNGVRIKGFVIHYEPGTHDWQFNMRVYNPEVPIYKVEIYCLFRYHTGMVWFDNVVVTKLSNSLCTMKHQIQYLGGVMPTSLSLPIKSVESRTKFIVIWTTSEGHFRLRHRRVIESIFYHHPEAHVKMYSNTLPHHFFYKFASAGYRVEVVRYDIATLSVGLPGESWVRRIDEWEKGESFFAHLSDYLRFVILFREGGVYTDMDSILVSPIHEMNVIGSEYCDGEDLDYCIKLPQFDAERYYLPIGFLALYPSHPLIYGALTYFDTRYNPELWPCGTVYLTLSYTHLYGQQLQHQIEQQLEQLKEQPEHEQQQQQLQQLQQQQNQQILINDGTNEKDEKLQQQQQQTNEEQQQKEDQKVQEIQQQNQQLQTQDNNDNNNDNNNNNNNDGSYILIDQKQQQVKILSREAFYPIPWQRIETFYTKDSEDIWKIILKESYAIHLWGQMSRELIPTNSSLVWRSLNQFSISAPDTVYGEF